MCPVMFGIRSPIRRVYQHPWTVIAGDILSRNCHPHASDWPCVHARRQQHYQLVAAAVLRIPHRRIRNREIAAQQRALAVAMPICVALRRSEWKIVGRIEEVSFQIRRPLCLRILLRLAARAIRLQIDRPERPRLLIRNERPSNVFRAQCRDVFVAGIFTGFQDVFTRHVRPRRHTQWPLQLHTMRRIRRPWPHLAQITYLLRDQRNRPAALRHISNGSAMSCLFLKDGGHHSVDLRRGQQHPAGDILATYDSLFGTAVAGHCSFAIDRAHLRRVSKSGLLSGKECAVLIRNSPGAVITGWVTRDKQLLGGAEVACHAGRR